MAISKKSKGVSKRGGSRPGAGRPRERPGPGGVRWSKVREFARLGADRDLVIRAMGIPADELRKPDIIARLQEEMARGEALHEIDLLRDVKRLRDGGPGKVNAVLASLRQKSGWNRADGTGKGEEVRPDPGAAVAEIQRMLGRFGAPR